ncbi:MAG: hypothetical protein KAU36_01785 [candidate division Zixibacteria bacterium]|nr:hypothetical protein [candidate division Zixibacteria bacterium]
MSTHDDRNNDLALIEQVDDLSEEVKNLALNLALYLAKAKSESEELARFEPEFIKLVNGTVKVVQEVAMIISAAKNDETLAYDVPTGGHGPDQIETKLRAILDQCHKVMGVLARKTDVKI